MKNRASNKDDPFEFSEEALQMFLIFPTVSVSTKQITYNLNTLCKINLCLFLSPPQRPLSWGKAKKHRGRKAKT